MVLACGWSRCFLVAVGTPLTRLTTRTFLFHVTTALWSRPTYSPFSSTIQYTTIFWRVRKTGYVAASALAAAEVVPVFYKVSVETRSSPPRVAQPCACVSLWASGPMWYRGTRLARWRSCALRSHAVWGMRFGKPLQPLTKARDRRRKKKNISTRT